MNNETPENPGPFVTTKQAAKELGYTVQHTRLLIREGHLKAQKLGRDWLILKESVATYKITQPQETENKDEG